MMASARRIKGITIEIGGDTTGLDKALSSVNKNINAMQRDLKDVDKLLKLDPGNTELLSQKHSLLQQQISETKSKLDALKEADKQAKQQLAAGDLGKEKYDALQREIVETEQSLESLKRTAGSGSATMLKISASTGEFATKAQNASDAVRPLSQAAGGLMTAAVAAVPATEELRSDLSKLDQNARESGAGVDVAREAFNAFTVVSDEVDSSVEATSNLLQAGFTESNLQKAVENLSGAYLRFPDTLKIESLADSMQETLATGKATGQFAELLDRLGVGADIFSEGLAQCATDAERQNYVLQTLTNAGLADTYNGWKQNNQALVENKKANQDLQEEMADFATTITPIVTQIMQFLANMLEKFNELSPATQNLIMIAVALTAGLAPLLSTIGSIANGVSALTGLLSTSSGLGAAFNILGTVATTVSGLIKTAVMGLFSVISAHPIIAVITAIIGAVIYLWNNCQWFRDGVVSLWNGIKDFLSNTWDTISSIAQGVWSGISGFLSGVWNAIFSAAKSIWSGVSDFLSNTWSSISSSAQSVWNGVSNFFSDIWDGMGSIVGSVASTIENISDKIWDIISDLASKAWEWGTDFIDGLIGGIKSKVGGVVDTVKGLAGKISEFLHFSRPDKGPLHEYEEWMPDFMEGLAKGINDNANLVTASVKNVAEDMSFGISDTGTTIRRSAESREVLAMLKQYLPYLAQSTELMLDTGVLVGATAPKMNAALGKINAREQKR